MLSGCSGSKNTASPENAAEAADRAAGFHPNRDIALEHFLDASMLDQKEEYASAILEYQEALQYEHDPAIYHSIAVDYDLLGKHEQAIQNAKEAVRRDPDHRDYRQSLAEVYVRVLNLDSAALEYEEVIRIDSADRQAWYSAARLLQVAKPLEALALYEKFTDYFGPDVEILAQMASIYDNTGQHEKVVAILRQMAKIEPDNADVKKMLGDAYLQSDSADAALALYNSVLSQDPDNYLLRAAMAHAYLVKKDYRMAAAQFDTVMQKDSLSVDQQIQFAQVFTTSIQKDSEVAPIALGVFQEIQKKYPKDWRSYWVLGVIYSTMRNDSAAIPMYELVTKLATWNPDGWVSLASIYYDSARYDKAIELMNTAKAFLPNEFRIYFLLGISEQRIHENIEAARALEEAIRLNGKSVDALSALGLTYDEMTRHEDSDSMYERALRVDPHNALVLNNYAYSLSERGLQLDRSLRMSEEAVKLVPDNDSYLDTYGWIFYQMGKYEDALKYIKKAIDQGSKSPVITEHLGDVYFKLNQKDQAMLYWQKAVDFGNASDDLKAKIKRGAL
jgi:tetratricopeptide (TPR) repeat protein